MADNVAITEGTGTTVAADDVGGVKYQRVKITWGVDGAAVDASATDPMPVVQTGTPALPTGAATAANQSTTNTALGAPADAAATTDAGTFSLIALFKRLLEKLTTQLPAALVNGRLDVNVGSGTITASGTLGVDTATGFGQVFGLPNDSAAASDAATATYIALFRRLLTKFGTQEGITHPSAARTASTNADFVNEGARGIMVFFNTTVASGTGGLTLQLRAKDPVSGTYLTLLSQTAVTTTGLRVYEWYPGASSTGGLTATPTSQALPRSLNINISVGDSSSYTYSVAYCLIP